MSEKDINQPPPDGTEEDQPEILVNEYEATRDSAVVVEEADRTVLLTKDETIVLEKEPRINIAPKNRPRKVYGGMWGNAEIAAVGLAMLAVLTVVLLYVFLVVPSNRELEANRAKRDRLEQELMSVKSKYGNITSTETQVAKLLSSVNDFEVNYLPVAVTGRNALYQRINGLIYAYGLVNTTGPDYSPLETADQANANQTDEERGRAKFRSLFPGVYVTMTVEGSYQNLRRFIKEVETGREFVVISAVELEPSDNQQQRESSPGQQVNSGGVPMQAGPNVSNPAGGPYPQTQQAGPTTPRGKTHGETVSLRLEMAAYFRRPNFVPMEADPVTQ